MSVVLVFTNFDSWLGIEDPSIIEARGWDQAHFPKSSQPIKKCVFGKESPAILEDVEAKELPACIQDGVYLIYDEIGRNRFNSLVNLTEKKESYVVVHDHGNYHETDIPSSGKRITVSGLHMPGPNLFYVPIFKILTDGKGNEQERIVTLFNPPLEAVLRFLNECLKPGNTNPLLEESFKKICSDTGTNEEVCKAVTEFYKKYKEQKKLEDYEDDLTQIRDILIDFATAS